MGVMMGKITATEKNTYIKRNQGKGKWLERY